MNLGRRGSRSDAARRRGRRRRRTGRGSWPARSGRPTGRCRSRPTSTTRRSAPSPSTQVQATPTRSRCAACIDGGCDLLLVETIFDTLNAKAAIVAIEEVFEERGARAAADDLGHDHRPQRPHAVGPDGRGLLGRRSRTRGRSRVGINCALGAREMRPYLADLARIADVLRQLLPERRAAQRLRRVRRAAGRDGRAAPRVRRRAASSTSSAAAAARRPITSARSRRPSTASRPRAARAPAARRGAPARSHATPASSRSPSGPTATSTMIGERTNVTGSARFRAADQGGRLRGRGRRWRSTRCAAAPTSSTSTWTRACSTPSRRMTRVPEPHRHRAGDRARAGHDRQLEVVGASRPG